MNKNKKINREKLKNSQKLNKIFAEGKIKKACKKLKSWRLDDCDLYVSLNIP